MLSFFKREREIEFDVIHKDSEYVFTASIGKNLEEYSSELKYFEGVTFEGNQLKIDEKSIFEIPESHLLTLDVVLYPGIVELVKNGIIADGKITFNYKIKSSPVTIADYERQGNILIIDGQKFLLHKEQADVLESVKNFNNSDDKNANTIEQYKLVNTINTSESVNSDNTISQVQAVIVGSVGIDTIPVSHDEIKVVPRLNGVQAKYNVELNKQIEINFNQDQSVYNLDSGEFLVFEEKNHDVLKSIYKNRSIKGLENIRKFIEETEKFIPDADLSQRIIGWGVYEGSSLTHSSNELVWIDEIDNEGIERKRVVLEVGDDKKSIEIDLEKIDFDKVEAKIDEARGLGQDTVTITDIEGNETKLSIPEAKDMAFQLLDFKKHDKDESKGSVKNEFVLIKTNFYDNDHEEKPEVNSEQSMVEIPKSVSNQKWSLYDYQKQGLQWLQSLRDNRSEDGTIGGLLADDMGLGKTLQIMSFLSWLLEKQELKKVLLVMPTTLIDNWSSNSEERKGEFESFFPGVFSTCALRGKKDLSKIQEPYQIYLTGYETITSQCKTEKTFKESFGLIEWDAVVCDEAQRIKNPQSKRTIAIKALKAKYKVACTATPIENNMDELWSICDWVLPGLLGSLIHFRKTYVNDKTRVHDKIAERLENFYIRRTKEEVLSDKIPAKTIVYSKIPATEAQKSAFEEIQSSISKKDLIGYISKLIGIMSHPLMTSGDLTQLSLDEFMQQSHKFAWLKETLDAIREKDEKVLIFSPSKVIQSGLARFIDLLYGINPLIISGDVNIKQRVPQINHRVKNIGFDVLILSPEVAGFGLTITEANHVIHFTRVWNPAKENQSTDRAYRIGQKKEVFVYIPVVTFHDDAREVRFSGNEEYYESDDGLAANMRSPEENLDQLIRIKGRMLKNFFSVAASASANELYNTFTAGKKSTEKGSAERIYDRITPDEFEAFTAALFENKGFKTYLSPQTGDGGTDVVVLDYKDGKHLLLQVCQTRGTLTKSKVQEVIGSKSSYEKVLGGDCILGVFTNGTITGKTTRKLINDNQVETFDGDWIEGESQLFPEYYQIEQRLSSRTNLF
ncbi:MAG: SNF2-related protein [Fibrobacterales bacterium]